MYVIAEGYVSRPSNENVMKETVHCDDVNLVEVMILGYHMADVIKSRHRLNPAHNLLRSHDIKCEDVNLLDATKLAQSGRQSVSKPSHVMFMQKV